jgi:hypothetical protein
MNELLRNRALSALGLSGLQCERTLSDRAVPDTDEGRAVQVDREPSGSVSQRTEGASEMSTILRFSDPREPDVIQPPDDAGWLQTRAFRQQLAASVLVKEVAMGIGKAHMFYEVWAHQISEPWPAHIKAAETAVRSCSEEVQACALSCLDTYAVERYADLEARLRSCDSTPQTRAYEIRRYARELVEVHRYHLRHETGRSELERVQFEKGEDE